MGLHLPEIPITEEGWLITEVTWKFPFYTLYSVNRVGGKGKKARAGLGMDGVSAQDKELSQRRSGGF